MDIVVGFPLTSHRHDPIMVVVDKSPNTAHFFPVKETYDVADVTQMFINEIFHLHGFPKNIISNRDTLFTSRFL